ncbi:MAG: hypothetical protein JNK85_27055 [Verrucomicrobiales bacterium]|nr:hypothetical protein [Verrucomicrobiales bacterium]
MTLVTLVSRQLWTQVLTLIHLRPSRVILLHSDHETESKGPMERLRRFLVGHRVAFGPMNSPIEVVAEPIPHRNQDGRLFDNLVVAFEEVRERHRLAQGDCVNISGGTRLMSAAAFAWAKTRGLESIYLDRDRELTRLEPRKGGFNARVELVDPSPFDRFDPLDLLSLQAGDEIVTEPGCRLELTQEGAAADWDELRTRFAGGGMAAEFFLRIPGGGAPPRGRQVGDALEYETALWVLKAGARSVRRGVQLSLPDRLGFPGTRSDEEIDCLFCHGGRLWLVECKFRRSAVNHADRVRRAFGRLLPRDANEALWKLTQAFETGEKDSLKLDLLLAYRIAGVQGQVVRVVSGMIEDDLRNFAKTKGIVLISKSELPDAMRRLLTPTP